MVRLAIIFALCASALVHGQVTQFFALHDEIACEGDIRNFTDTTLNIPGLGDEFLNRTKSWMSQGFWNATFVDGGYTWAINRYEYLFCTWFSDESIAAFQTVEKVIPYDFHESAILISEDWAFGEPRHIIPPEVETMTYIPPIKVKTWVFLGSQSFVFFKEGDLDTPALCIEPDDATKERGYGLEWSPIEFELPWSVAEIRRVASCPQNVSLVIRESNSYANSISGNGDGVKLISKPCQLKPE